VGITVGSVEVDVIPNAQGIQGRLRAALVPPASQIGDEVGRIIGRQMAGHIAPAVRDGINAGGRQASPAAARQGGDAGGAFGRMFRGRVEAALRSLPDITIGANTSEADADIRALRVQLETLARQRVGIDVDAATARRQIDDLERELTRLGASHPDVAVRIDTAAAVGELAALRAEIDALDGRDIDVRVDPTIRSFSLLVTAAAAFGPAIIPALPIVAAGLGAIAAAGVAAGVGLGSVGLVAVPAIKDIAGALQAQKAAQDAATRSTSGGAGAAVAAQQRAIQMAGAVQSLAAAERNGARQVAAAQEQVTNARRNAAQVAAQASQRAQQAARAVQDAERTLADAQRDARRAQEDLTDARRTAAAQLQDLNDRLAGSALNEREAVLRVREAQADLNKSRAAGTSQLEKDRAQLAYDQAVQGLKEQRKENARLKAETVAANKAGVEGSDTVRAAQERLANAQRTVADRARAVTDAQAEQARTAQQNARDIAAAQGRIVDAQKNVAVAQQQSADSIASAQRQIKAAQLSAASGTDTAAAAQAKYQAALAKLTPEARGTFNEFVNLRGAFTAWSRSLQPAVMPLFTRALVGIRNALPGLTPFVLAAAKAIGELQDRASRGFKSPWWLQFKSDMAGAVGPALVGLGVAFANIFKGMAGIIGAFLPHMDSISDRMQSITQRFANWGTSLRGSPEFERFLSYSSEQAPFLAETLGNLFGAIIRLGVALAPLAGTAQSFINAISSGISAIPVSVLTVLGVTFASIAIGAKIAAAAMAIWRGIMLVSTVATALMTGQTIALNAAMRANVIGLIITAIAALVVALIYAYQHSETFRSIVQAAWDGIKATVSFAWNNVLKPVLNAIVVAVQTVGRWAVWLWQNILSPVFNAIALGAKILLTAVVVLVLLPIIAVIKILGAIGRWLWDTALGPAFRLISAAALLLWRSVFSPVFTFIGDKIKSTWNNFIRPAFIALKLGVQDVGDKARWLWERALRPAFNFIGDKASWLWSKALKPAFDRIKQAVGLVGDAFGKAKDAIKLAWDKVEGIAKKPVRFVIDHVYNRGIVPVWNNVADAFGAPPIKEMPLKGWATGGVLPGYTPGRDVHKFYSPTGGGLELSGGESIFRPEFTRAVGSGFVSTMNRIAARRGSNGVAAALAPTLGGNPDMPTQRFSDGGIFGWIGKTAAGLGSKAWEGVKKTAGWLGDTLEASARAGVKYAVDPILKKFPGADTGWGKMIRRMPTKILNALFGYSKEADKRGGGGLGGPRIQAGLRWAKTQDGKPYQWAGNGNPSWDCLTLSSVITTPAGHKALRDVNAGDSVIAFQDGKLVTSQVLAKWNTGEQQLYKVRTRNRALRSTAGHRVLVAAPVTRSMTDPDERVSMAEWGTEWKHVRDLTTSDYLVTYTGSAKEGGEDVPEDLAWLMGLWLADGSVNANGGIRICVYDELAEKAMSVLREHSPNRKVSHHPRHGVMVSDIRRTRWMIRNGFCGKSHERSIPPVVMEWSHKAQTAFLNGYADGDGSYKGGDFDTAPLITYKATSRELIEGVRELHLRQGDRVTCTRVEERSKDIYIGGKKIQNARPIHSLDVARGKGAAQSTGAGHRPGLLRLVAQLKAENMSVQRVLSVEPDGIEETWDIEVEDSHSFVSDGLVSHNCSGFVSAIESVIRGQKPHRRWATMAFQGKTAPAGWVLNAKSPYRIGITNAGVGHTAGTIAGINVESRGGQGVIVGKSARGWNDKLFTSHYGFMPGSKYDSGGYLPEGLSLAYNGTGQPEPVFTRQQADALARVAVTGGGGLQPGDPLMLVVPGQEFPAYIDSRAQGQVHATLRPLAAALRTGRKG